MAGVTFLAFGNGSPDVFSTFAAMKTQSGSLAIGELIGAAGFITAVVAGSMALVRPFKVARKSFVRDVGFFIVAASFSMIFLADGYLHMWESAVMVGFYGFYVVTVVVWHWYLTRKKHRRDREAAARDYFHMPGTDDAETDVYLDNDADGVAGGSRTPLRAPSGDDFANLERAGSPALGSICEDADDNTRDHWMAEISSNMRVSRPRPGERRNTHTPIRPSLVGALEFRSVLSSLQKSRNIQSIPINLRRYSDDPYTTSQQQNHTSTSNPNIRYRDHDTISSSFLRPSIDSERSTVNRLRAVSANGASGLQLDQHPLQRPSVPQIDFLNAMPPGQASLCPPQNVEGADVVRGALIEPSTLGWALSPPPDDFGYLATSPAPMSSEERRFSTDLLAPPGSSSGAVGVHRSSDEGDRNNLKFKQFSITVPQTPKIKLPRPSRTQGSSPASPFPIYDDDPNFVNSSRTPSLLLPPPSIGSESTYPQNALNNPEDKVVHWWPYKFLPPPQILVSTLFPTLYAWHDKNFWERLLGVVAAPSVLLLAITLPVVEAEKDDEILGSDPGFLTPVETRSRSQSETLTQVPPEPHHTERRANGPRRLRSHLQLIDSNHNHSPNTPTISISDGEGNSVANKTVQQSALHEASKLPSAPPDPPRSTPSSPKEWNRWLVSTQIFTAPFFIVLLYWANNDPDLLIRNLLLPTLYGLMVSLILFAILLLTTTIARSPRYRYLFCFLGFIVSIAWISTIANEVVGVLKAFGIILGISDAILGLTIFAVGNSLGDLVADITIARLGYPVMALSACFGGPMLNILLGIGLSGLYMTIKTGNGNHERHQKKPWKYKPYQIEFGGTLIISGITLLVTLLGLLIAVPLNRWRMDRKIGWGLVTLWCASTIGNVIVEVMGWGDNIRRDDL